MVSYYNPMYRQQASTNGHFQTNNHVHSWYPAAGYHHQQQLSTSPAGYLQQEDPQMWHHQHGHPMFHHNEFPDFVHTAIPPLQPHAEGENLIPSPPITETGSAVSSPGVQSGTGSPPQNLVNNQRPPPARSPYEWIKKTSYLTQPNPGKTRTKDKYRVVYTDHQRIELEKEFTFVNKYITIRRKAELAATLGLSERQVKIWFQNRRAKERKQNKKRVEEKNQLDMYHNLNLQAPSLLPQHNESNCVMNQQPAQPVAQSLVQQQPGGGAAAVIQRFLQDQTMKLESDSSEQLG